MELHVIRCPNCGANLDIFDERKHTSCDYCGVSIQITGNSAKKDYRKDRGQYDPEYERISYAIESGDVEGALKAAFIINKRDPSSPHVWMARGFALLNGKDLNEDYAGPSASSVKAPKERTITSMFKKKIMNVLEDEFDFEKEKAPEEPKIYVKYKKGNRATAAGAAWKRAMRHLDSDDFLSDYADLIAWSIVRSSEDDWFDSDSGYDYDYDYDYEESPDDDTDRLVKVLGDVSVTAEKEFGRVFFPELCQKVFERYSDYLDEDDNEGWENAITFLINSFAYDPDCRSALRKSKMLAVNKDKGVYCHDVFEILARQMSKRVPRMTDQQVLAVASHWDMDRDSIDDELSDLWDAMMDTDGNDDDDDYDDDYDDNDDDVLNGNVLEKTTKVRRTLFGTTTKTYIKTTTGTYKSTSYDAGGGFFSKLKPSHEAEYEEDEEEEEDEQDQRSRRVAEKSSAAEKAVSDYLDAYLLTKIS